MILLIKLQYQPGLSTGMMKKIRMLKATRANKNYLGEIISYLMVTAVAIRGLVAYPEVRLQIAVLLTFFIILILAEPLLRRQSRWGQPLFLIGQISIMVGLFSLTPLADFWAILLLPACVYVMRHFSQRVAWAWIVIFILSMSVMMIIGAGWVGSLEFIFIYVASYVLVGSYAFLLKQTDAAQRESQQLAQRLQQSNAQLQEYIIQVEELTAVKERNRLARDLHDAVTQTIFSMTLITRTALILQERDPQQVKGKLLQLQELAQGALQEMRALIYQLRTLSVEEDGLYPVLQKFVADVNGRENLHITMNSAPETLPLTPVQQQELYRIIQEAVNNVVKHARANSVTIDFSLTDIDLSVAVLDNGVGFDPSRPNSDHTHIGLDSMRERAKELGGTLTINAQPGTGTEIKVIVPIAGQREVNE